jgi:parallel beta-helix repeat protein
MRNVVASVTWSLGLILSPLALGSAFATEYFVGGANASDGNPGTREAPLASLGAAATKVGPGDVVNIRGTHNIAGDGVYVGRSGVQGAPIVFRSAPGETAKLTGRGLADFKAPLTLAGNHLQIRDLDIGDSGGFGVLVYRGSNIEIVNNTIHDCHRQGIFLFAEENVPWPSEILVENNKVFRNAKENMARNKNGNWPGAISTQRADRVRVINNTIYENWGEGIVFNLTNGSVARGNTVYDNFSANLYMDHARNCVFEKNFVYSTGNEQFFRNLNNQWTAASGVQMANEDYGSGSSNPLMANRVLNNIVVAGGWGFFYGRYGVGGGMKQTLVANNTFVGATRAMLHIDGDGHSGAVFANNMFVLNGGGAMTEMPSGASSITFKNNLWQGGASGPAGGAEDVAADPQLANRTGRSAVDFRIAAGSPARGKGTALPEVSDDFWGGSRPNPPDMGAHQQGSSAPNPSGIGGNTGSGAGGMTGEAGNMGGGMQAAGGMGNGMNVNQGGSQGVNPGNAGGGSPGDGVDPTVEPPEGPRIEGCACTLGAGQGDTAGGWLLLAALGVWLRRLRQGR